MPIYNSGIMDRKEWASSAAICLKIASRLGIYSNVLAIGVVSWDRGIWGTTIVHNTDSPISGGRIVISVTLQTRSLIILKRKGWKISIAQEHRG